MCLFVALGCCPRKAERRNLMSVEHTQHTQRLHGAHMYARKQRIKKRNNKKKYFMPMVWGSYQKGIKKSIVRREHGCAESGTQSNGKKIKARKTCEKQRQMKKPAKQWEEKKTTTVSCNGTPGVGNCECE